MTVLLLALLIFQDTSATDPYMAYREKGVVAFEKKDYATFLDLMEKALALRPHDYAALYNLAVGNAQVGKIEAAVSHLRALAKMGLVLNLENAWFKDKLSGDPHYSQLVAELLQNQKPRGSSTVAFTVSQKDLYPEGIAHDAATGRFFVSSIHHRKIIEISASGGVKDFVSEKQDGIWSVMGLAIDGKRRVLWAASSSMPQTKDLEKDQLGRTGVFKYQLDSGKLLQSYLVQGDGHNFGDLAVLDNGDLYITDTRAGSIWTIGYGSNKLEKWLESSKFRSLQGICFNSDASLCFVADYTHGVYRIDMKTREMIRFSGRPDLTLAGIDGLIYFRNSLIAIQNGIPPHRVVQWRLNENGTAVRDVKVLEINNPIFDEPTLGTVVGDTLFYVAVSQWGSYTEDHLPLPLDKLKEIKILKTRVQ